MLLETETRRSPRIQVRIPLVLLWNENGEERSEMVNTQTISWFGCAIQGHHAFPVGSSVQAYREGKTANATALYCLQDHELTEVGLEFAQDSLPLWEFSAWGQI
jgi:hypothetical protein